MTIKISGTQTISFLIHLFVLIISCPLWSPLFYTVRLMLQWQHIHWPNHELSSNVHAIFLLPAFRNQDMRPNRVHVAKAVPFTKSWTEAFMHFQSNLPLSFLWDCKIWILYVLLYFSIGSTCNCILPRALQVSAVCHEPDSEALEGEKTRLRSSTFSCLSSISMRQKHLSTSSLFLSSPLKGCLPPWELRRSNNNSLKER